MLQWMNKKIVSRCHMMVICKILTCLIQITGCWQDWCTVAQNNLLFYLWTICKKVCVHSEPSKQIADKALKLHLLTIAFGISLISFFESQKLKLGPWYRNKFWPDKVLLTESVITNYNCKDCDWRLKSNKWPRKWMSQSLTVLTCC